MCHAILRTFMRLAGSTIENRYKDVHLIQYVSMTIIIYAILNERMKQLKVF